MRIPPSIKPGHWLASENLTLKALCGASNHWCQPGVLAATHVLSASDVVEGNKLCVQQHTMATPG